MICVIIVVIEVWMYVRGEEEWGIRKFFEW